MSTDILLKQMELFRRGSDLRPDGTETFFDALLMEEDEGLIADVLAAWNGKGISTEELFSLASLMRGRMKVVESRHETVADIVGTGGSAAKTFNVSTAAAFVVAGAGIPVAKHGNRAATSSSGSADVLTELGVIVDSPNADPQKCLDNFGICFLYAPGFHSLSPTLARARRGLRVPTIFNNVGPLCNPAKATHQLLGVWNRDRLRSTGTVVARLGTSRSWVVNSADGLDEISLDGATRVVQIEGASITEFDIQRSDFTSTEPAGSLPKDSSSSASAELIVSILNSSESGSSSEMIVLINAAALIYIYGNAADLPTSFQLATESVRSGSAAEKLRLLATETNK